MRKGESEWLKKFNEGISDDTIDLWDPAIFSELKDNEVKSVVNALKKGPLLKAIKARKTLNLSEAKLEPKNIVSLLEVFNNCQLKKLDVSHQNLLPGAVEVITSQLKNQTLQELRLRSCELDELELLSILEAISQNQSLKELHITHQNLSTEMVKSIAKMLRINATIERLVLEHCQVDEYYKFSPIVDELSDNRSLRKLDLSTHRFSYRDAKHLDSILAKHNPPIICENVSKAVKEFDEILTALATLPAVELSSLNSLQLVQGDMEIISSQVVSNKNLLEVNIKQTSLNNVMFIIKTLENLLINITVDLSSQQIDTTMFNIILSSKANIVSLNLSNIKLDLAKAKIIADRLEKNQSLASLNLSLSLKMKELDIYVKVC